MSKPSTPRKRISLKEPTLIALETLRTHKLRSFLTLLGVILSVSTLIVVVSMIEGTNRYISEKVANFGANVFQVSRFPLITSFDEFLRLQKKNKNITWDDYLFLRDNMRLAKTVGIESDGHLAKIKRNGETMEDVGVTGVTGNMAEIDTREAETGRYIIDSDGEHRANVAMIGADVSKRLFKDTDPLGKTFYVDGEAFDVVGIAKEQGSAFGQSQDGFVLIPVETYQKMYGSQQSLNIEVQALTPDLIDSAQDEARILMRARHHLAPKADDNFGIIAASAIMDLWKQLTGTLASSSIFIVLIFMGIGGIVIMNIMLASVTERTREIGVRKSLGATRRDILLQFVIEASVMAAVGGIIGVLVATAIALLVRAITHVPTAVPIMWVTIAVIIATGTGLVFGVYPAYKASKLDPIEALRFEA
ncbi:MAG TPA: ABC transporter permease [Candidatus Angelobacter sp.]|nr:ABC transporter permease [Candidatus Angelobacter sp.]